MNPSEPNSNRDRLDEATSRRLAKLRDVQFDTSDLRKAVEAQIPPRKEGVQTSSLNFIWRRPMRAAAASLLLAALIASVVMYSSSGPVLASAQRLSDIHEEVLAGTHEPMPVDSFVAAKAALEAKWPDGPALPALPKDHVVSCCIHKLGRKKIACVCFKTDGVAVTMAVAKSVDVKSPASETLTFRTLSYRVQSCEGISMLMTEHDDRWVCLMGRLPANRLAELASSLQF